MPAVDSFRRSLLVILAYSLDDSYNLNRGVPFLDEKEPLSRPGCWVRLRSLLSVLSSQLPAGLSCCC